MISIQSGASLPPRRSDGRRIYPFAYMQPGDMFFVPDKPRNTMMSLVSAAGRRYGFVFRTRHIHMRKIDDAWVPCSPQDADANLGVAVYRDK